MDFSLEMVLFFIFLRYHTTSQTTVEHIGSQQTEIHAALRPQVFHAAVELFAPFVALISVLRK